MEENEEFDSDFSTEDIPISEGFWNYMENYWHNNREFPESTESSLNKKADLIGGKVPTSQLPSYVDDVLEFDSFENLPNPGEKGKIYLITNNNSQFRWGVSGYIQLNSDEFLMTTNTEQNITGKKYFLTSGGSTDQNNKLIIASLDHSLPGMTFYKSDLGSGNINFNENGFNFVNAQSSDYINSNAKGFKKAGSNDDYLLTGGGGHIDKNTKEDSYFHSGRNFTEGTLIKTTVDYSVDYGHQFFLEMKGNMYSGNLPLEMKVQGYIYYGKIICERGYSTYPDLKVITAMNLDGKLCFWFPRLGYWQGFSVKLTIGYGGLENGINRVTAVEDLPDPQGTKRVEIYIDTLATQEWTNSKPYNDITDENINNWNNTFNNQAKNVTLDDIQNITGQKNFLTNVPLTFKYTDKKSWAIHKPLNDSLILAPSKTLNGEDWDWANQINLGDNGSITSNGYIKNNSNDDWLLTGGGGHTPKNQFSLGGHTHQFLQSNDTGIVDANSLFEDYKFKFNQRIENGSENMFPVIDNANSIISIASHPGGYGVQLGFNDNEESYIRSVTSGSFGKWKQFAYRDWVTNKLNNFISQSHPSFNIAQSDINNWKALQLASDNYVTKSTNQVISGLKAFVTGGGNYAPLNNALQIYADDGSLPSMTWSKAGSYVGQLMFNSDGFHFKNGDNDNYYRIKSDGFKKNGSSDDYFLTGGGDHKLISDFVTLNTPQTIIAAKDFAPTSTVTFLGNESNYTQSFNVSNGIDTVVSGFLHTFYGNRWKVGLKRGSNGSSDGVKYSFQFNVNGSDYIDRVSIDAITGNIETAKHGNSSDWNQAYNWGNHAIAGYATTSQLFKNLIFTSDLDLVSESGIYRQEIPSSNYGYTTTLNLNSSDGRQQLTIERTGGGMKFRGTNTGSGNGGWSTWKDVIHSGNFSDYLNGSSQLNSKVTNLENVTGIGFSSGNADLPPYFYHPINGYRFLATQTWVGQQGYLTSANLNGYATEAWVSSNIPTQTLSTNDENNLGQALTLSNGNSVLITNNFVGCRDGSRNPTDVKPNSSGKRVRFDFANASSVKGSGNYAGVMTYAPWDGTTASTGDSSYQLAFANQTGINGEGIPMLKLRKGIDEKWSSDWYKMWSEGDFSQSDINNWNYLAANAATQTWTSANFFSKTGGTIDGKVKITPGIGTTGNSPIAGIGDPAGLLISGDNGLWGTSFGHHSSTGDLWIQPQRFDGGSALYNINLAPLGGNVTINNQTAATQSWVQSQNYAPYDFVEAKIDELKGEVVDPAPAFAIKNEFTTVILTDKHSGNPLELEGELIPESFISIINLSKNTVDLNRDGKTIDRIYEHETSEYYITKEGRLIKKGTYKNAQVLI